MAIVFAYLVSFFHSPCKCCEASDAVFALLAQVP